jgi:hypothetical protein
MIPYKDINCDSGVEAYEYGNDYIIVLFKDGKNYKYTCQSAGAHNVEKMKLLAERGDGLNFFINKNVRKEYSKVF